jgi:membrane protease YdiL (CAAX protease family)
MAAFVTRKRWLMKLAILFCLLSLALYSQEESQDLADNTIPIVFPETPPPLIQQPNPAVQDFSLPTVRPQKKSYISVPLSILFPGLGHLYLGEPKTAVSLSGSCLTYVWAASRRISYSALLHTRQIFWNTWDYGIYAAYRDTRACNPGVIYSYKMPMDSLLDLTYASFNPAILKKTEVWGGLLAFLGLGLGATYICRWANAHIDHSFFFKPVKHIPFFAFPVGIGEEALYRGYLQSQIAEISNPLVGMTLSTLAFGAAHLPKASLMARRRKIQFYSISIPIITSFGAYASWLTYKNRSLKESVAIHSWYDFVLFAAEYLNLSTTSGSSEFAFYLPF